MNFDKLIIARDRISVLQCWWQFSVFISFLAKVDSFRKGKFASFRKQVMQIAHYHSHWLRIRVTHQLPMKPAILVQNTVVSLQLQARQGAIRIQSINENAQVKFFS